jgi:hypothetical protein
MRTRVRITDLTTGPWARLQHRLQVAYKIPAGAARVCAEFESGHPQDEVRHVEMPVQEFATVLTELAAMAPVMNVVTLLPQVTPATTWGPGQGPGYDPGFWDRRVNGAYGR